MLETATELLQNTGPGFWYGADVVEDSWRIQIPTPVIDELDAAVGEAREEWFAIIGEMHAARGFIEEVRAHLHGPLGVVVGGRLPLEEWGEERAHRAVALLSYLMSPPVAQSHSGITLYPVEDRGMTPAPGVRRSWTNVSQPFHTDGPWVRRPPAVVALHCLRAAGEGGMSQCISIRTLFQHLAEESVAVRDRLEEDFYWHRQGEHAAGEELVSRFPMVWRDDAGRWCARLYDDYVLSGYQAAGIALDEVGQTVLEGTARLARDRQRRLEFMLHSGEIEWVNNRWCAHARSEFEPRAATQRPRLLVRVWHRLDEKSVALDD